MSKIWMAGLAFFLFLSCASTPAENPNGAEVSLSDSSVFPKETGKEASYLGNDIAEVKASLTMWGDDIDPKVDSIFKNAVYYNDKGDFEKAQLLFNYALLYCGNNRLVLFIDQFDNLLLRRAYALSDSKRAAAALKLYDFRLDALKDANGWTARLPDGLKVSTDKPKATIEILIGMCYEDRSITKTVLRDFEGAWEDAKNVEDYLSSGKRKDLVLETYGGFISNCAALQNWGYIIPACEAFKTAMTRSEGVRASMVFKMLRSEALAFVNLGILSEAKPASDQLIQLSEQANYSDEYSKADKEINAKLATWAAASPQDNASEQLKLALMFYKGEGVARNLTEAARWFAKAAEQGNADAQICLAAVYAKGEGVEQDFVEYAKWTRRAAEQDNIKAQFNLGNAYANGEGLARDYAEAAKWLIEAGKRGHANARSNLVNPEFWKTGADQGDPDAQYWLGNAYAKKNPAVTAKWWRKAAEQGHAVAQYELGFLYLNGEGVDKNALEVMKWWSLAAEQGYVDAFYNLGSLFLQAGKTEKASYVPAYVSFSLAYIKDADDAKKAEALAARDLVAKRMTPEQIEEAQRLVREWKPTRK